MRKHSFYCFTCLFLLFVSSSLYAEDGVAQAMPQQGFIQTLIMIGIAVLFFYFILWRPEQKRRKALEEQRSNLNKGDKVTAMGIVGTVVKVQENTTILRMVDGNKIEMLTAAITDVQKGSEKQGSEKQGSGEEEASGD